MTVRDRVAVVTGAGRGIGRTIALQLAGGGARLALVDILPPTSVEEEIRQQGGDALSVEMDIAADEQVKAGFARILKHFGKVDILVNNAGITRDQLALRMKRADWDAVIAINLTGAYLCTQQVLGHMLRQRSGRIINVASVVAQMGNPGQVNYVASKAGLIGLTKALAMELASRNITVNAVAPGFIISPMTDSLPEKVKQALLDRIPLGRMGTDEDVATGVCFLASDEAGYITGHVLNVNGGLYSA